MNQKQLFTVNGASARVIEHSASLFAPELITVYARYPRMVHADAKTHRLVRGWLGEALEMHADASLLADENLSRNGRSSRAVPVARLLAEAENPYVPHFMANQSGMVAGADLDEDVRQEAERVWRDMAAYTLAGVKQLQELGVHKQWANRPLEWSGYIDVLITATNWENFFHLRDDAAAQPEVQDLAKAIRQAIDASSPRRLMPGEWHLPYVDQQIGSKDSNEIWDYSLCADLDLMDVARRVSVARCARLTYEPFNGEGSIAAEVRRHHLLLVSQPVHASPAEHQATPDVRRDNPARHGSTWENPHLHGNLSGWIQYRKTVDREAIAA